MFQRREQCHYSRLLRWLEKHQGREYRIVLRKKRQQQYIIVWCPYDEEKFDLTQEREWIKKQWWYSAEALI